MEEFKILSAGIAFNKGKKPPSKHQQKQERPVDVAHLDIQNDHDHHYNVVSLTNVKFHNKLNFFGESAASTADLKCSRRNKNNRKNSNEERVETHREALSVENENKNDENSEDDKRVNQTNMEWFQSQAHVNRYRKQHKIYIHSSPSSLSSLDSSSCSENDNKFLTESIESPSSQSSSLPSSVPWPIKTFKDLEIQYKVPKWIIMNLTEGMKITEPTRYV